MGHPVLKLGNEFKAGELGKTIEDMEQNPKLAECKFRVKNLWVSCDENRSTTHGICAANEERKHKKVFHFQAGEPPLLQGNFVVQ